MKILIATMNCGEGHNAIARSIKDGFSAEHEVKIVNIYEHLGKRDRMGKNYFFLLKYLPHIYSFIWNRLRKRNPEKRYRGFAASGIRSAEKEMERAVKEFQPDAVICTHVQASNIFCWLKIHNRLHTKLYAVLTDFVVCPFWEGSVLCDTIFTPHELSHPEMISRGFREEQLLPCGIPVNPKFEKERSRSEARKKLGIPPEAFVVLSMNGGFGIGNIKGFVKNVSRANVKDLCVLVVCGKNERAYRKVKKLVEKRKLGCVRVFGFVDNIDEMLSASDLFFCRGGSSAVSEALISGIPFAVREDAILQERLNGKLIADPSEYYFMKRLSDARRIVEKHEKRVKTTGVFVHSEKIHRHSVEKIVRFTLERNEEK